MNSFIPLSLIAVVLYCNPSSALALTITCPADSDTIVGLPLTNPNGVDWTLGELFPPGCTAIVPSIDTTAAGRRTEVLIPDTVTNGINLAPSKVYYLLQDSNSGTTYWKSTIATDPPNCDGVILARDRYFTIRNWLCGPTDYTITGPVYVPPFNVILRTSSTGKQDTPVGLRRHLDIRLDDLNLGGTPAFTTSLGTTAPSRRDELLVFDNGNIYNAAGINKAVIAVYYYYGGWRKVGQPGTADFGNVVIPAGWGFLIRKYQDTGANVTWTLP